MGYLSKTIRRRDFLMISASTATPVGLAGCQESGSETPEDSDTETQDSNGQDNPDNKQESPGNADVEETDEETERTPGEYNDSNQSAIEERLKQNLGTSVWIDIRLENIDLPLYDENKRIEAQEDVSLGPWTYAHSPSRDGSEGIRAYLAHNVIGPRRNESTGVIITLQVDQGETVGIGTNEEPADYGLDEYEDMAEARDEYYRMVDEYLENRYLVQAIPIIPSFSGEEYPFAEKGFAFTEQAFASFLNDRVDTVDDVGDEFPDSLASTAEN